MVLRLRNTGNFHPRTEDCRRVRAHRVLAVEPEILEPVEAHPGTSTRRLALHVSVSHYTYTVLLKCAEKF
jgi:hypothetical protein